MQFETVTIEGFKFYIVPAEQGVANKGSSDGKLGEITFAYPFAGQRIVRDDARKQRIIQLLLQKYEGSEVVILWHRPFS